jgi:hypothetical protein
VASVARLSPLSVWDCYVVNRLLEVEGIFLDDESPCEQHPVSVVFCCA